MQNKKKFEMVLNIELKKIVYLYYLYVVGALNVNGSAVVKSSILGSIRWSIRKN